VARALVPLLAALASAVLWVANCSGPQPSVVGGVQLEDPSGPGEPYHVQTTVRNAGPGHGQVNVTFRLHDPATGQTFQGDRQVQLEGGETARVVAEILAPPGSYEPDVEVEYPPR
jgi:hypothetical protein